MTLFAFDVANGWMMALPYLAIIAVFVFIIGFAAVSIFAAHRTTTEDKTKPETKEPEQAGQPQNDDGQ